MQVNKCHVSQVFWTDFQQGNVNLLSNHMTDDVKIDPEKFAERYKCLNTVVDFGYIWKNLFFRKRVVSKVQVKFWKKIRYNGKMISLLLK